MGDLDDIAEEVELPAPPPPSVTLSPEQAWAATLVRAWMKERDPARPVFRLFGCAGTGKSTVALELSRSARQPSFAAYTGKAALEMRRRGCREATTIHRLLYTPIDRPDDRLQELRRARDAAVERGEGTARLEALIAEEEAAMKRPGFARKDSFDSSDLLVIDEVSMVGEEIAQDLIERRIPILCLGDPGQLPPVKGTGYFVDAEPDVLLEHVHRQAEGSPIIHLATLARQGQALPHGDHGDGCAVVNPGEGKLRDLLDFEQVIVGTNRTRRDLNHALRKLLGRTSPLPQEGDRLICLRNDHQLGFLNGSQWLVLEDAVVSDDDAMMLFVQAADDLGDGRPSRQVVAYRHHFEGRENDLPHWRDSWALEFDYAYAITCHKAQGSQFASVFVVDESRCFRQDAARWQYTAITRASKRVVVRR